MQITHGVVTYKGYNLMFDFNYTDEEPSFKSARFYFCGRAIDVDFVEVHELINNIIEFKQFVDHKIEIINKLYLRLNDFIYCELKYNKKGTILIAFGDYIIECPNYIIFYTNKYIILLAIYDDIDRFINCLLTFNEIIPFKKISHGFLTKAATRPELHNVE